jgi:hypothetical protein
VNYIMGVCPVTVSFTYACTMIAEITGNLFQVDPTMTTPSTDRRTRTSLLQARPILTLVFRLAQKARELLGRRVCVGKRDRRRVARKW